MIRQVVSIVVGALIVLYLVRQVRKPTRWVGRPFVWLMNRSHAPLTGWGLTHVRIDRGCSILDVGCGGGRTVQTLAAAAPEGHVVGVDYAAGSVAGSRAVNAALIAAGRVEIRLASVSALPFPDATFDLVTAVETHYYWPDLPRDMKEVLRVVKPGGRVILIAEAYRGGAGDAAQGPAMKLLGAAWLSVDQHRALLEGAGFAGVEVFEERRRGWLCATGRRPAAVPADPGFAPAAAGAV